MFFLLYISIAFEITPDTGEPDYSAARKKSGQSEKMSSASSTKLLADGSLYLSGMVKNSTLGNELPSGSNQSTRL